MKSPALNILLGIALMFLIGAAAVVYYELPDNGAISFGADNDYNILYDATNNRLEIRDAAENVLLSLTDGGTTGALDVTGSIDPGSLAVEALATAGGTGTAPVSDGDTTLTMTDVLTEAELNSEAELEAQIADITNIFTNLDGALDDDDLSDNLLENLSDINITGRANGYTIVWNSTTEEYDFSSQTPATTEAALELQLTDVTNVYTDVDGTPLWSTLDTEAELETQIADITDIFTNLDGALDDDDLSDDDLIDIGDVDETDLADDFVPHWDFDTSTWVMKVDATSTADQTLIDDETITFGDSSDYRMLFNSTTAKFEITDGSGNIALNIQDGGTEFVIRMNGNTGPKVLSEESYVEDMSTGAAQYYGYYSDGAGAVTTGRITRQTDIDTETKLEAWLTDVTDVYTDLDGDLTEDDLTDNSIDDLDDVDIDTPTNKDFLIYSSTETKWVEHAVRPRAIVLTAAAATPAYSNGCAAPTYLADDLYVADFDPATDEHAIWIITLPSDWDLSSTYNNFTVKLYYTVASDWAASSDKVNWAIKGQAQANSTDLTPNWSDPVECTDVWQADETTGELLIAEFGSIDIENASNEENLFRIDVYRDADDATNDTCTADARLIAVKLEYSPD